MGFKQAVMTALAAMLLLTLTVSTSTAAGAVAPGAAKLATEPSLAAIDPSVAAAADEYSSHADTDAKEVEEEEAGTIDAASRWRKRCCRIIKKYKCIRYRHRKCIKVRWVIKRVCRRHYC